MKNDTASAGQAPFSYLEALLLILAFVVVSLTFAGFVCLVHPYGDSISLPMLAISGIILLLIFLTGIAYIFTRAGLQDKGQALGLPPGSIQAVIALSLIVLFVILAISVFTSLGDPPLRPLKGLSSDERDKQIVQLGPQFAGWQPEENGKYTLFVRDPVPETRADIGKQLIVLIGTLMTSAVSFYFGSRATAARAPADSTIRPGSGAEKIES